VEQAEQKLNIGFIFGIAGWSKTSRNARSRNRRLNEQILAVRKNPPQRVASVVLRVHPEGWDVPRFVLSQTAFSSCPICRDREVFTDGEQAPGDLYVGGFSSASQRRRRVIGREGWNRHASHTFSARKNPRPIRTNGRIYPGHGRNVLPKLVSKFSPEANRGYWNRSAAQVLSAGGVALLRGTAAAQVIYVSLPPGTMAREFEPLCAAGVFELARVHRLDMFPQRPMWNVWRTCAIQRGEVN